MVNLLVAAAMSFGFVAGNGKVHTVIVGGKTDSASPKLLFTPETVDAEPGDKIQFVFKELNHTATQSTFGDPCKKMDGGVDSGFMFNEDGRDGLTWDYTVESKEATWFYCKQKTGNHCGKGMVFSINPVKSGEKTHEAFKALAMQKYGEGAQPPAEQKDCPPVQENKQEWTVAEGQGVDETGSPCSCSCLCGYNAFPDDVGKNAFGGWGGMVPKN